MFSNESCFILIQILLELISQGPIDNKLLLVQVIAWCNRPRSEDFVFSVIWILSKGLLQNFAYVTSIVLLKDVQDFIVIL